MPVLTDCTAHNIISGCISAPSETRDTTCPDTRQDIETGRRTSWSLSLTGGGMVINERAPGPCPGDERLMLFLLIHLAASAWWFIVCAHHS
jgi:hypothetical protein